MCNFKDNLDDLKSKMMLMKQAIDTRDDEFSTLQCKYNEQCINVAAAREECDGARSRYLEDLSNLKHAVG